MSGYNVSYSGPSIDQLLSKANEIRDGQNGWIKLNSTVDTPVDLDTIQNPGNYFMEYYTNGPEDYIFRSVETMNLIVRNGHTNEYRVQIAFNISMNFTAVRKLRFTHDGILPTSWVLATDGASIFNNDLIRSVQLENGDRIEFHDSDKILWYVSNNAADRAFFFPKDGLDLWTYDITEKAQDVFAYADTKLNEIEGASGSSIDYNGHISDSSIHVTAEQKTNWSSKIKESDVHTAANTLKPELSSEVTDSTIGYASEIKVMQDSAQGLQDNVTGHITNTSIHPSGYSGKVRETVHEYKSDYGINREILYNGSVFLQVVRETNGYTYRVFYSTDYINWTECSISSASDPISIWISKESNGMFIIYDVNQLLHYSADGINWKTIILEDIALSIIDVVYYNNSIIILTQLSQRSVTDPAIYRYNENTNAWEPIEMVGGPVLNECDEIMATMHGIIFFSYSASNYYYSSDLVTCTSGAFPLETVDYSGSIIRNTTKDVFFIQYDENTSPYNVRSYISSNGIDWTIISGISDGANSIVACINKCIYTFNVTPEMDKIDLYTKLHCEITTDYKTFRTIHPASITIDGMTIPIVFIISNSVKRPRSSISSARIIIITDSNIYMRSNTSDLICDFIPIKEYWDMKVEKDHIHTPITPEMLETLSLPPIALSTDNVSGVLDEKLFLDDIKERITKIAINEDRYNLTIDQVQNGDYVYTEGCTRPLNSKYWTSICYGNGKYVVIASDSNIFAYSTDGINWTEVTVGSTNRIWQSVCYGYDKFVAVAYDSNIFAYSTDGINWTEGNISSTNRSWTSICYGNGKYIAVAYNTNLFSYSTDGINWTEVTVGSTVRLWQSVCYGKDKFVAVTNNSNKFAYSTDGINWTEGNISNTNRYWFSVCYGNGKYVVIASGSNIFAYSTDGINWTEITVSSTNIPWQSIYYDNGKFITIINNSNIFAYSTDGINWTEGTISNTYRLWASVCYGNGKYVVIASGSNIFLYSIDGITWADPTADDYPHNLYIVTDDTKLHKGPLVIDVSVPYDSYCCICYGNGKYVAITGWAVRNNRFVYSTDGINWTEGNISSTSRTWTSVCYGNGKYIAVAYNTNLFSYSTDGINWTEGNIGSTGRQWFSVCYGNGKFVAVANNTNIFAYSNDGINWTEGNISSRSYWYSVCYGYDKFVAVANGTNIFAYSTDGITWTEGNISNNSRYWQSVCYGNGKYVAIAYNDNIFAYSNDGINWTEVTVGSTVRLWRSVCYGNGKYVAVARESVIFAYSNDGINWTEVDISNTIRSWYSVCYGNGKYIAIAYDSITFASIDFSLPMSLNAFTLFSVGGAQLSYSAISNKPTTLEGFGITDGVDDITTIPNYVSSDDISALEADTTMHLDGAFGENQARLKNITSVISTSQKYTTDVDTFHYKLDMIQRFVNKDMDILLILERFANI